MSGFSWLRETRISTRCVGTRNRAYRLSHPDGVAFCVGALLVFLLSQLSSGVSLLLAVPRLLICAGSRHGLWVDLNGRFRRFP